MEPAKHLKVALFLSVALLFELSQYRVINNYWARVTAITPPTNHEFLP